MQFDSQILRFQQGSRSRHPAPDATIASLQSGTLSQQGERLAVLVDLTPLLPYRSREIRTLAVKTYWASSGTIVARLRRALAAANRYLVDLNEEANASAKCTGSITCAVFAQDELFLGQIGAAHTYVLHGLNPETPATTHRFEVYPERKNLMIALGAALPPSIHISYTQLEVGSTVFLASTSIAESQARELWQQAMGMPTMPAVTNSISKAIENNRTSGTVIFSRIQPDPSPGQATQETFRRKSRRRVQSHRETSVIETEPMPTPVQEHRIETLIPSTTTEPMHENRLNRITRAMEGQAPTGTLLVGKRHSEAIDDEERQDARQHTRTLDGLQVDTETGEILDSPAVSPTRQHRQTDVVLVSMWIKTFFTEMRKGRPEKQQIDEKERLQMALRSLLPEEEKAPPQSKTASRTPPQEKKLVLQGLLVGFAVVITLLTLAMNAQFGGADRATELEPGLLNTRNTAYNLQDKSSWNRVTREARGILLLDENNRMAQQILAEAEAALVALENAAILDATQLYELPITTGKRKLLLVDQTLVILDTVADEVISFQLNDDFQSLKNNTYKTLLRRGQAVGDTMVGELLDIAWIPKNYISDYNMIYVLGENGVLFTHELTTVSTADSPVFHIQHLGGDLSPGSVSAMETFGTRVYLVHQLSNEILSYNPVNGNYGLSQLYFSVDADHDLNNTFDIVIDQRVYLLMGDGTVKAYYDGIEDHSFSYDGVTDQAFSAQTITVEQSPDGAIILGDPQAQRIALFSKRGRLMHLFRANDNKLERVESIAIAEDIGEAGVLFFIAANRLYVAPLPAFVR